MNEQRRTRDHGNLHLLLCGFQQLNDSNIPPEELEFSIPVAGYVRVAETVYPEAWSIFLEQNKVLIHKTIAALEPFDELIRWTEAMLENPGVFSAEEETVLGFHIVSAENSTWQNLYPLLDEIALALRKAGINPDFFAS